MERFSQSESVVLIRLSRGSDVIKSQLKSLVAFTASDADLSARMECVVREVGALFLHEKNVMEEYHHLPFQHLKEHQYFEQMLLHVKHHPENRHLLRRMLDEFIAHNDYHDCCLHSHVANIIARNEKQYA